jgi:hypothetical protein
VNRAYLCVNQLAIGDFSWVLHDSNSKHVAISGGLSPMCVSSSLASVWSVGRLVLIINDTNTMVMAKATYNY